MELERNITWVVCSLLVAFCEINAQMTRCKLTSWTFRLLSSGKAKLSASRSSDENPFAEVPGLKAMSAFAHICNLQTEIEMKESYDAIIMTPNDCI